MVKNKMAWIMSWSRFYFKGFERENGGDYLVEETEIKELEGLEVPPAVISQTQRQAYKCDGPSSGYCGELKEK